MYPDTLRLHPRMPPHSVARPPLYPPGPPAGHHTTTTDPPCPQPPESPCPLRDVTHLVADGSQPCRAQKDDTRQEGLRTAHKGASDVKVRATHAIKARGLIRDEWKSAYRDRRNKKVRRSRLVKAGPKQARPTPRTGPERPVGQYPYHARPQKPQARARGRTAKTLWRTFIHIYLAINPDPCRFLWIDGRKGFGTEPPPRNDVLTTSRHRHPIASIKCADSDSFTPQLPASHGGMDRSTSTTDAAGRLAGEPACDQPVRPAHTGKRARPGPEPPNG